MATRSISSQRTLVSPFYNLQIAVGSYVGNGSDNVNITSIGFKPKFVLIKGGANNAVWRINQVAGDSTLHLAAATANFSNSIQELLDNGFQVGTDATVNAAATTYHWVAITGTENQNYFRTGRYRGTAANPLNYTDASINFTPEMAMIKRDGAVRAVWRNTSHPALENGSFETTADISSGELQGFLANGFNLGGSSRVNGSGFTMYYAVFKTLSSIINVGSYTGNGQDNRNITGLGFQPDFVWVKVNAGVDGVLRTSTFSGDSSAAFRTVAPTTNQIQGFISDGFQVGTANHVNGNTLLYYWFALKAGNYNIPITRVSTTARTHI